MKADAPPPKIVAGLHSTSAAQPVDFALKETRPFVGDGRVVGDRILQPDKRGSVYDLVERMDFLYVRVVKARDLPIVDIPGRLDPFVEVRVGNYKGVTKHIDKSQDSEWNIVFAFSKDQMQASVLDVAVKYKDLDDDWFVRFDLNEVPTRVPPDSPLAPQWYPLEDTTRERIEGELMLAVWTGTQADDAFHDAWHFDAATCMQFRPKVYHAPTLWYARVNVIEAQDLEPTDKTCFPEVCVKARVGDQVVGTKALLTRTLSPLWNADLLFVVSELSEDHLVLTVENRVSPGKDEILGSVSIPLSDFDTRADDRPTPARWYNLEKPIATGLEQLKKVDFSSKLHLRLFLDGGYHVLDESAKCSSDLLPTAKELCTTSIGVLELGILKAERIATMKTRDGRETSDTYCVAKYGRKWVRTRTVVDSLCPKYNEQYTWEVFDRATVFTVGVFDDNQFSVKGSNVIPVTDSKDHRIGKVTIQISTLETDRIYTSSLSLMPLHPSGVQFMGELHLAIRFSCTSYAKMLYHYSRPLLPKMHYVQPISVMDRDRLRHHAIRIMSTHFAREVVEYMYEYSHFWSLRRSKANFFRLMSVLSGLHERWNWFGDVCPWKNPIMTLAVHILFLMLVCFPVLILPMIFLYMFFIVVRNYRYRPRYPPRKDTRISHVENCHPDELDEEFDTFPTSRSPEVVRMRYDRLRSIAGRLQQITGDVATQGERFLALLSWRNPFATPIFGIFCLMAAVVVFVAPLQVVVALAGLYMMKHPRLRSPLPALPINFLLRLSDRTDTII